jgi:ferredoxin-NADP reductase
LTLPIGQVTLTLVPRSSFVDRLRALRRDVRTATAALVGVQPPPLVRVTRRSKTAAGALRRPMRVARLVRETADAVTVELQDAAGEPVRFAAGQFFTLFVPVDGVVEKRAYSASSSPLDPSRVAVTVKRVKGGRVSSHIVERLREGDVLEVIGPSGSFTPAPARGPRRVVLVGGGSGITPLASIARTLLATEPGTQVVLVYGNRAREDVIFHDALVALAGEHAATGRFSVHHVLQRPPLGWTGVAGLLDGSALERALASDLASPAEYFLCGPDPMMRAVHAHLAGRGVPHSSIQEERFVSAHAAPSLPPTVASDVTVRDGSAVHHLRVEPGRTVLEAAFDARVDMPFSCTVGGCGACRVKLVDGALAMDEPNCLTPEEHAQGWVLACVARPGGPCTLEVA